MHKCHCHVCLAESRRHPAGPSHPPHSARLGALQVTGSASKAAQGRGPAAQHLGQHQAKASDGSAVWGKGSTRGGQTLTFQSQHFMAIHLCNY